MGNTKEEWANTVVLAGIIRTMKLQEDQAFFLIDVTGKKEGSATKWIPCTIYKEVELMQRIDCYQEGDQIKIRGYVRAWSQKKDGEWKNAVDIRVTEIKGPDPKKAERASRGREPGDDSDDDFASRW